MIVIIAIFIVNLVLHECINAASIDGTTAFKEQSTHYVLRDTNTVKGFVRFSNGFTIIPGDTHGSAASLDICLSCSGGFDLRDTSTLILLGDLKLDSATTLTSSGKIFGHKRALILGGDLTLAANQVIHLDGNLIIDGQGHDIFLNEHSQLMLDNNATITIQNATIHNKRNSHKWPSIAITTTTARLTLSDVELALDSDFYVNSGQIFIHNDVAITGTSALIWRSIGPCTIEPNSCLYFDTGTTFSYAPSCTNKNLIRMADRSSTLHLNGCSLLATHTGLRLSKGTVLFDNNVTLDSTATNSLTSFASVTTKAHGTALSVHWSPNGRYLAVGGQDGADDLRVYTFDGTNLTQVGSSINYDWYVYCVKWSPDGKYLAVGGDDNSTNDLRVYTFDGTGLTQVGGSIDYGETVIDFDWSPDGKYLAVGGDNGTAGITIYQFHGAPPTESSPPLVQIGASIDHGMVYAVAWSRDGKYLAAGGSNSGNDVSIYRFNGESLTKVGSSIDVGENCHAISWSPDGTHIAIAGYANTTPEVTTDINIYQFNGTTLSQVGSTLDFGSGVLGLNWSPNGKYLAVCGRAGFNDFKIYYFKNNGLSQIDTISSGPDVYSVDWTPDSQYIAVAGDNEDNDLAIYKCNYINETATQAITNGIILGNSAQGNTDDVSLQLLANAHVTVNGIVNIDNNSSQPTFVNRDSSFILQNSSSKFHITPSSILGWKNGSIIKTASDGVEGDYNLQNYTGADSIIGYSEAPMSLVYSTSLAVGVETGLDIYNEEVSYETDATVNNFTVYGAGISVADGVTVTINAPTIIYGSLDTSAGGKLLINNTTVTLGTNAEITGGIIEGNNGTILLSADLSLPSAIVRSPTNTKLKIKGTLKVNGRGNSLIVDDDSQLVVAASATLTLARMKVVKKPNKLSILSMGDLPDDNTPDRYLLRDPDSAILSSNISLLSDASQLVLDSISISLDRDLTLTNGKLYIYNDVVFTGTNKFSYASSQPMYINSFSNLRFDYGTTFSYSPGYTRPHTADQRNLITMTDKTASITFDNCNIELPDYGMQLTKGTVIFNNKVTFNGNTDHLDTAHSFELGDGTSVDNDVAVKFFAGAWVDVNGYLYHNPA